ncbi:MAG: hypothetical protein CM1200mP18_23590 [Gammaproteobacteria bacterium]|nr:MAG: hypothetical protein CM1200mP18_23590 [Gammaproteobacteria bacterium]
MFDYDTSAAGGNCSRIRVATFAVSVGVMPPAGSSRQVVLDRERRRAQFRVGGEGQRQLARDNPASFRSKPVSSALWAILTEDHAHFSGPKKCLPGRIVEADQSC